MTLTRVVSIAVLCSASALAMAQQPTTATASEHSASDSKASTAKDEKLSSSKFVKEATAAGEAEVKLGKLGAEKATDPELKAFAQQMVTDHTKANTELTTAAKSKDLKINDSPDLMHKVMDEKFDHQKAGKEFDQDFIKQMVKDHKATVELFEKASASTEIDPDLKAWAKKTLPTLKMHLKAAEQLQAKLVKST